MVVSSLEKRIFDPQSNNALFYIVEVPDAEIERTSEGDVLRIFLSKDARVAEDFERKNRLFGDYDTQWALRQLACLERGDERRVKIARPDSPVRWAAGGGLYILNEYILMNLRAKNAPTHPGYFTLCGGYGERADLLDPYRVSDRERAEEICFVAENMILVPDIQNPQSSVDYESVITEAARKVGVPFAKTQKMRAFHRDDVPNSKIEVYHPDGTLAVAQKILFTFDPYSAGIDTGSILEISTEKDIRSLDIYFLEHYQKDGKWIILGPNNDIVLIPRKQFMTLQPQRGDGLGKQIDKQGERFKGLTYNGFTGRRAEERDYFFHIPPVLQTMRDRLRETNYNPRS